MSAYYKNLLEVEKDIQILQLKNEIQEEKIKLRLGQMKQDLSPQNLFQDVFANAAKGITVFKILRNLFKKIKSR